jgi:uncharacterized protein YcgI (DUF1989 family)
MSDMEISDASYSCDIPAERPWSRVLRKGQTLRIIDSEGQQAVDALLYCAEDPAERYSSQDTLRVQGSTYIELGTRLISNKGLVMARITAPAVATILRRAAALAKATRCVSARRRNISMRVARISSSNCQSTG